MKRWTLAAVMLVLMFSLSACSEQGTDNRKQNRMEGTTEQQTEESSESGNDSAADTSEGKEQVQDKDQHISIAYFTWAENTHVENPNKVDVDASTSASVLPPEMQQNWLDSGTDRGGTVFHCNESSVLSVYSVSR